MKNITKLLLIIPLAISVETVFSQRTNEQLQQRVKEISSSNHKITYLESFLNDIKNNPLKRATLTKKAIDSINLQLQMDYQILLLTVFKDYKDKNTVQIKNATHKAYEHCLQVMNGDELTKKKQYQLNQAILEANDLIKKYNFLK